MTVPRLDAALRRPATLALLVTILAVGVRVPSALHSALWQDEVASARIVVEPSAGRVLSHVAQTESTPPGWYLLAWALHRAGIPIEPLRFLSVAASAALTALVVLAGRRVVPAGGAALGGLLVALGWQFVFHGRELRAYALLALLAAVFAVALARAVTRPSRWRLAGLAAATAAGAWTHYFFLLTVAAGLLWVWTAATAPRVKLAATAACLAGAAPLAGWLPGLATQLHNARFAWIAPFDPPRLAYLYAGIFTDPGALYSAAASDSLRPGDAAARLLLVGAVLAGCLVLARASAYGRLAAMLCVVPVVLAAAVWAAGARVVDVRNLIAVGPFAALALGALAAVLPLPSRLALAAGLVGLVAAGLVQHGAGATPPYDRVARALLAEGWRPGDPVLVLGDPSAVRSPLSWYLSDAPLPAAESGTAYLLAERWRRRPLRAARTAVADARAVPPYVVERLERGVPLGPLARRVDGVILRPWPVARSA